MNVNHYPLLCCPETGDDLELVVFSSHIETPQDQDPYEEIHQGGMYTSSGRFYPIIDGIPRMLPLTKRLFPAFYKKYKMKIKALPLDPQFFKK